MAKRPTCAQERPGGIPCRAYFHSRHVSSTKLKKIKGWETREGYTMINGPVKNKGMKKKDEKDKGMHIKGREAYKRQRDENSKG